jgi:hypothetical protein
MAGGSSLCRTHHNYHMTITLFNTTDSATISTHSRSPLASPAEHTRAAQSAFAIAGRAEHHSRRPRSSSGPPPSQPPPPEASPLSRKPSAPLPYLPRSPMLRNPALMPWPRAASHVGPPWREPRQPSSAQGPPRAYLPLRHRRCGLPPMNRELQRATLKNRDQGLHTGI